MVITNTQKIKALQRYFGKSDHNTGPQIAFRCPICNDPKKEKKKLMIRITDGWYHCWVCGLSGKSFFTLFKKTFPQAVHDDACEFLFEGHTKNTRRVIAPSSNEIIVELPKGSQLVGVNDLTHPDIVAVQNYLISRGLTKGDMLRWRICATKQGAFQRKAIIPSFDSTGKLNYFVSRAIDESSFKYMNSKRQKTEIVFNEIDINWSKPVLLVEGVFDALKSPDNTIPVLGSSLPKNSLLFRRLWENGCSVTVAFDPDLKEKSHTVCDALSKAGLEVNQVWAPDGRDFGSMTKKDVADVLKNAKPWKKIDRLVSRIRNISSGSLF